MNCMLEQINKYTDISIKSWSIFNYIQSYFIIKRLTALSVIKKRSISFGYGGRAQTHKYIKAVKTIREC